MGKILCLAFLLALPFIADSADTQNASQARNPEQILSDNWKNWTDKENEVSRTELQEKISRPDFSGEDAAVLVTLAKYMQKNDKSVISKEDAVNLARSKDFKKKYEKTIKSFAEINRNLFAAGKPDFEKLQQGPAGDCYFFSGVGWIAKNRPDVIVNSISQTDDGKYRVRFPDGEEAVVDPPTDAEMIYNNSASTLSDGIWMPVIQKAYGAVCRKHQDIPDDIIRIDFGGSARPVVHMWTGHKHKFYKVNKCPEEHIRKELIFMETHGRMAEAGIPKEHQGKIPGHHVYAVLGFDKDTDTVTIWNPWGTSSTVDGESNLENGYARDKGVFRIKLNDFMKVYSTLEVEQLQ